MPRSFDETQTGTPVYPTSPPGSRDTPDMPGHTSNPVTGNPYGAPDPTPVGTPPQGIEDIEGTPEQKKAAQDAAFRKAQEDLRQQELAKKQAEDAAKKAQEEQKKTGGTVTVVPGGQGGGATGGNGRDALARLKQLFASYGLPDSLGDWAWEQLQQGSSEDEVTLSLYDRPEFKTRFPAIAQRVQSGLAPISPSEYIAYERQFRQLMSQAGLPPGFYDSNDDMTGFIANDVSLAELSARVQSGFIAVKEAPQEVRDEFARLFGVDGDAALASFVLDRNRSTTELGKVIATATAAGVGWSYGMRLDMKTASWLGDKGKSAYELQQGFGKIQGMSDLFDEMATDTTDLTAKDTGLAAVFGNDINAQRSLEQRAQTRTNLGMGGSSLGAATTSEGAIGTRTVV